MERPEYHFQPIKNWMNDPNGMCFINGLFHMFYQHNPMAAVWGNMTWGHAVSPDMVHWKRLPHALYPDMPYDKDGVFSGCCVVKDGIPHILYTGVYPETVCLAIGSKDGMNFTKYDFNPILTNNGRQLKGWRDPYVWKDSSGCYNMLIGSGDDKSGFVETYKSDDLVQWNAYSRLTEAYTYDLPDTMWECPVMMINKNEEVVLFVSALPSFTVRHITGKLLNGKLEGYAAEITDAGDCLYAPNIVRNPDGRYIMFAWLRECGDENARAEQGWQGMLSLPRELEQKNGKLYVCPAKEVDTLRMRNIAHIEGSGQYVSLQDCLHFEIDAHLRLDAGQAVFELLRDEYGRCVRVVFDNKGLQVLKGELTGGAKDELKMDINSSEDIYVRIFVDGTSIEIFINSEKTLTTRAYPLPGCGGLNVFAAEGCEFVRLDIYSMLNCYQ